jgi:hypothetical protein
MTQNPVTAEDVVKSLGESKRFPEGSPQFQAFAPFVGQLVEIVGNRLQDKVGFANLSATIAQFARWLTDNDAFMSQLSGLEYTLVKDLYLNMAEQLDHMAANSDETLANLGTTEAEVIEKVLDGKALELYHKNELDFAQLLVTSPEVLIPQTD